MPPEEERQAWRTYAAAALQGICAFPDSGCNGSFHNNCGEQFVGMAEYASKMATAMLAAEKERFNEFSAENGEV